MKKKVLAIALTGILAVASLTGCGSNTAKAEKTEEVKTETQSEAAQSEEAQSEETQTEETQGAEADAEQSEAQTEKTFDATIKIAASATPHAEILEEAKPILEQKGIHLEITVFDDYVLPMTVVESGELDANYAVHVPYLESFNEEQGTHLANAGGIHYEPFGIYPGKKASLDEVANGDTIAIPNDTTNEARALLLLQDNGLIKLKDDAGLTATVNDIVDNPYELKLQELEAAQVARVKEEVEFVVLNGNYALEAGLSVGRDSIAYEASDSTAAKTYVNIIAVKEGNENNEEIKALVDVLKSDEITKFIQEKYDGAVVPFK